MKMNEHGEFVDDFDPYGIERHGAYADTLGKIPTYRAYMTKCPICGAEFKSSNGRIYCSDRCQWKASAQRKKGNQT